MQNLMPPVNTPDNLFHDGNPTAGIEGTIVTAEFLNNEQSATRDIQSELINVLAAAAMEPDPKKKNQLVDAIKAIIEASKDAVSGNFLEKSNNLSDADDAAKCRENIGAVPATRKVNNKPLGTDINLTTQDIWGFSESIATARNINQIMTPGLYYVVRDDIAAQCTGLPENKAGELEVLLGAQRIQFYRLTATPRVYYRLGTGNNTWQAWVKQYDTQNKPTAEDLGLGSASNYPAVQANGGTHNSDAHRIAIDWGVDGKLWASVDDTDQGMFYTSKNRPPEPNLSEYMRGDWSSAAGFISDNPNDPYMHHTKTGENVLLARRDWADSRFVYDVQRGSQALENGSFLAQSDWEAPTGCFMTGIKTRTDLGDARTMGKYYRALMIKTASGSWRQVGN